MATSSEANKFCVKPLLLDVLKSAGAKSNSFTLKEVLQYLKTYIASKFLFDVKNPRTIHCENDLLGTVFGVKTFTITDVPNLLSSNMFLMPTVDKGDDSFQGGLCSSFSMTNERKRTADSDRGPLPKRQCVDFHVGTSSRSPIYIDICESPSYDSSAETVFSVQGYETAVAKDSSDDLWFLETEEEFEVEIETEEFVEYEVASLSESSNEDYSDTESEVAEVVGAAILVCQNDADVEFWADSSDNEEFDSSDTDPEITDCDNWKCRHCSASNRPLQRFCQKCWQLRNNWLPEHRRPKRHRRRLKRTISAPTETPVASESLTNGHPRRKISQSLDDLPLSGNQDNNESCHHPCTSMSPNHYSSGSGASSEPTTACVDSEDGTHESVSGASLSTEANSSSSAISTLCNICLARPKNAVIVHGRTGHQMCCYGCGKKLWERNKPCPVCRRTIQKVVQNFVV